MPIDPTRDAAIEQESADWIARRERGLTATEQDAFFQWLADDPRHGDWLARHQRAAASLKRLAHWRPEHATRPNPDLLASRPVAPTITRSWPRWFIPLGFTVAATLTVILWLTKDTLPGSVPLASAPILRKILEDGSTIDLSHDAAIEVAYTPIQRSIRLLRGEASFKVAKNPDQPFIVSAASVNVRAVGTAFNVNFQHQTVDVLVTEGTVAVATPEDRSQRAVANPSSPSTGELGITSAADVFLTAGQRTTIALADLTPLRIETVTPDELARVLAWQPRQLEFNDTPLGQVAAEFNRDNRVRLVVADPTLASMPIGASLRSDNVEGFVSVLEASFGVTAERRADGVIVLRRSP